MEQELNHYSLMIMKVYRLTAIASTLALSFSLMPLVKAQTANGVCPPGNQQCLIDRQIEDSQYNPNIYFRTPQTIKQQTLYRDGSLCQDSNSTTCNQITPRIESSQDSTVQIRLRELQQQRLEQNFPR